jgi:hypothetical protein
MCPTVEVAGVNRDEGGSRHVSVTLSELARDALAAEQDQATVAARLEIAVRCYLEDRGTDSAAWPFPGFLRGSEIQGDVGVELDVAGDLWLEFGKEAAGQGVSVDQLAEHAAFYFAAEVDAGRVTDRILDDLEAEAERGED